MKRSYYSQFGYQPYPGDSQFQNLNLNQYNSQLQNQNQIQNYYYPGSSEQFNLPLSTPQQTPLDSAQQYQYIPQQEQPPSNLIEFLETLHDTKSESREKSRIENERMSPDNKNKNINSNNNTNIHDNNNNNNDKFSFRVPVFNSESDLDKDNSNKKPFTAHIDSNPNNKKFHQFNSFSSISVRDIPICESEDEIAMNNNNNTIDKFTSNEININIIDSKSETNSNSLKCDDTNTSVDLSGRDANSTIVSSSTLCEICLTKEMKYKYE
jgi:hypothetical protein